MKINKTSIIFFTFFMLVISNSKYLIDIKLNSYFEYFILGLLSLEIIYYFIKSNKDKKDIYIFIVIIILFLTGLILQNLSIIIKLRLIFTMIALTIYMFLSNNYLNSYENMKAASYGMFFGIIITTFISLITGTSLLEKVNDNILFFPIKYGFNGGIEYKNMFSTTITAIFIGIFLYFNYVKKNKIDLIILIVLLILQICSASKGGYIIFGLFLILEIFNHINKKSSSIKKSFPFKSKVLVIISLLIFSIFVSRIVYDKFLLKSSTYSYRIRGVDNYLRVVKNDKFHLYFGCAEKAFANNKLNYAENIRKYLMENNINGDNGTYEMGYINIIIKNGLIGFIGFIIGYIWIIRKASSLSQSRERTLIIGIFIILLISSFVESYICNIHQIFGIYCYLIMMGIFDIAKHKEINSNLV